MALLDEAFTATAPIPGDCGDEYRRPPFLTASGDLSHHLAAIPPVWPKQPVPGRPGRWRVDSGSVWEPLAGYARAQRVGDRILVSGTTATHGQGQLVGAGDAAVQATYILDKIAASIAALGGSLRDVVRTRVYLQDVDDWQAVSAVHGRYFGDIRPANTLLQVAALVGSGYKVEIEAEAVVDTGD
jgi:enamine deaminase RidA (YjgF/YER057c/UK114 family)